MKKSISYSFVEFGNKKLIDLYKDEIVEKVIEKYKYEYENANIIRKICISYKIRKEINNEIEKVTPKSGLYYIV